MSCGIECRAGLRFGGAVRNNACVDVQFEEMRFFCVFVNISVFSIAANKCGKVYAVFFSRGGGTEKFVNVT